jgi:predicted nuclease of predicted toxin-antitoxin system
MARLLADEDFPMPVVNQLRQLGHDVWAVVESDKAGSRWPDEEVFREAQRQQRAILTLNRRHFLSLHRHHPVHSGLILCTHNPDPLNFAAQLHEKLMQTPLLNNQCLRIYRPSP